MVNSQKCELNYIYNSLKKKCQNILTYSLIDGIINLQLNIS